MMGLMSSPLPVLGLAVSPDAAAVALVAVLSGVFVVYAVWLYVGFERLVIGERVSPVQARGGIYRRLGFTLALLVLVSVPVLVFRQTVFVEWLGLGGP